MTIRPAMPELTLEAAAHWGDLEPASNDAILRALQSDAFGIAISAPETTDRGAHETLPLAGIRVCTLLDAYRISLACASIVCSCVETGEVRVAAMPNVPMTPSTDEEPGGGAIGDSFRVDLFETPGLPETSATWVIRVVLNDVISNAATVRILAPGDADPAAEALLREQARKPAIRALNPRPSFGPGLPSYEPQPGTPHAPETPAIRVQVKRAQEIDPKGTLIVHGSFLTPVLPRDVRPPPGKDADKLRGPRPTATIPMALVAVASDQGGCALTPLVVPSYQPLLGEGDALTAAGAFTFDYFQLTSTPMAAQTLFLYVFAGALVSEVAACALVDPGAVLI